MAQATNGQAVQFHPIAAIFPLMEGEALELLAEDIREHGLREPIMRFEGQVLDGRNRLTACRMAGVEPRFRDFAGNELTAIAYAWSMNRPRRHLDSSQAAIAEAKRAKFVEAYGAIVEHQKAEAAERKAEGRSRGGGDRKSAAAKDRLGETVPSTDREANKVREQRAKAAGTNGRYINEADLIIAARPDLAEKIEQGKMTIPQAKREIQRAAKRRELEAKARMAAKAAKKAAANGEEMWRIVRGDCLHGLADLDGAARLIFADPPYNIGVDYGSGAQADQLRDGEYLDWCQKWMAACHRALTPDGSLWVMIGDEYAAHFSIILNAIGFHQRAWIKWYETFGVNQANNFNRTSRHIFYATKDRKRFVFNADAVSRPSDRLEKYGDKRADPNGKLWDDVWQIPRLTGTAKERIPDFPTQLPLAILRPIVGCASDPGDLVVDPFSGSATTGAACVELGRRYIGFEKELQWVNLSKLRLGGMGAVDAAPTATAKPSRSRVSVAAGASAATSGRKSRGGKPR